MRRTHGGGGRRHAVQRRRRQWVGRAAVPGAGDESYNTWAEKTGFQIGDQLREYVQAVLICAQRLGARNARAGQLISKELEEFRSSTSADSVTKHQSRYVLQIIKHVTNHPDNR